jgi:hypothetical protein
LGCHTQCQDSRLGSTARLLHLCRLGLDGRIPDHSTFSKNRHGRFRESDTLRRLFESVVQRCIAEGLISADGFAVDASLIAADVNQQRSVPSREWKPEGSRKPRPALRRSTLPLWTTQRLEPWAAQQPSRHEARALIAIEGASGEQAAY